MSRFRPRHSAALLAFAVFSATLPLHAATYDWKGSSVDNNFTTAGNWVEGTPPNDGTADLSFANTPAHPSPNASSPYSVAGLVFSGTTSYTLSGTLSIGADGVQDTSTVLQNVSAPTTLTANQTWSTASAEFEATGPLTLGNHSLQINANNSMVFAGISGAGGITLGGTSNVFLTGTDSSTGNTVINSGSLILNPGGSITSSNITVNHGALIAQGGSIANSNGVVNLAATTASSASASFSTSNISIFSMVVASGDSSSATITQLDQTVTIAGTLGIATGAGSTGTYTLANAASLFATTAIVGNGGNGFLSLAQGNAEITYFTIGTSVVSNGTFTMNGGTLVSSAIHVGDGGRGAFIQNAGIADGGEIDVGVNLGIGTYSLVNGTLYSPALNIGVSGNGNVSFSGGSAIIGSVLLSSSFGASALNVSGNASLAAGNITVNSPIVPATMTQNGGTVSIAGQLILGGTSSLTTSVYTLTTGQLNAGSILVGALANATFVQNGGAVFAATPLQLDAGIFYSAADAYILNGGTLALPGIVNAGAGPSSVVFNGGTLIASIASTSFIPASITLQLQAHGFIFDTAGFTDSILAPLTHASSLGSSPDGGVNKLGIGNLTLAGNVFSNGPSTIAAGLLTLAGPSSVLNTVSGAGNLSVADNSALQAASLRLPAVSLGAAANLSLIGGTSKIGSLSLSGSSGAWTSTLSLQVAKLIVEPSAITKAAALTALRDQVAYGSSHTTGILDFFLPANTRLAIVDNAALATPFSTFGGLTVDSNSLLIAPELLGDANIDGHVDLNDLNTVLNHLGQTNANWTAGNFDGAATIDLNDLNAVLNNLGVTFSNNALVTNTESLIANSTPTPEPASALLLAPLALLLSRRRSRSL